MLWPRKCRRVFGVSGRDTSRWYNGYSGYGRHLLGLFTEEGDQVVPVLALLETTEGHLGARNVLLGVLKVLELCYPEN